MNTPRPKQDLLVEKRDEDASSIYFHASPELIERIKSEPYGRVKWDPDAGHYVMVVSPLYEFEQVSRWLDELAA
jgi:hypothetical protein